MQTEKWAFGPEGSQIVLPFPVGKWDNLSPREKFFLPEWDETFHMDLEVERTIALGLLLDKPVMLVGPTGSGKTTAVKNMAYALGWPLSRINFSGDTRASDVLGEKTIEVDPATGQSVIRWVDGVIPDAKRNGRILLLDEIDACPPEIAFVLQSLLEKGHPLTLTGNNGEVVTQECEGPGLRIFATANTVGKGDSSGIYAGTRNQNAAFLDRFLVKRVGYLPKAAEIEVLTAAGVGKGEAERLVEVARVVREGAARGDTTETFSTRRLVMLADVSRAFRDARLNKTSAPLKVEDLAAAYPVVIGDKLSDEDFKYFGGVISRIFASGPLVQAATKR